MLRKKSKILFALALMSVLCITSVMGALALNENGAIVAPDENTPVQASITKVLRMPVGTITPNATFEFLAQSVSVDGDTARTAPALNNLSVVFSPADIASEAPVNNIISIEKETGNIFAGVVFPHAGIFVYNVTEVPNTNTAIDESIHEWLSYSQAQFTLTVYVANNAAGNGLYVQAVVISYESEDDDGQDVEIKVGDMTFTNHFVRTNGAVDPDDPDPTDPNESTLSVSKTVAGDFASQAQYFDFSINLDVPDLGQPIPAYFRAYVVENDAVVADLMVSTSAATQFSLRHGQRLVFVDTPVGTSYAVQEAAAVHYIPSFIVTTNGVLGENVTGTISEPLGTGTQFVGELANSADFTNTRDFVTPMGLNLNNLPFIGLIVLAVAALAIFLVVKTRKAKQYH